MACPNPNVHTNTTNSEMKEGDYVTEGKDHNPHTEKLWLGIIIKFKHRKEIVEIKIVTSIHPTIKVGNVLSIHRGSLDVEKPIIQVLANAHYGK
jgi:hypothetical protein